MHGLVRSASFSNYGQIASSVGLDPLKMLRDAHVNPAALADADIMVNADALYWLLQESARLSGCDDFGLRLAESRQFSSFGPLALVLREEPTLRQALHSLSRYMCLQNEETQFRMEEHGELVLLHIDATAGRYEPRQPIEMFAGLLLRLLRVLTDDALNADSVCFTHGPPASLATHHRVLGPRVRFAQECNAIVLRTRDLDMPIPRADPEIGRHIKRRLDFELIADADTPDKRVRKIVRMLLPTGLCTVERVARQLGVDRRTLHRHLLPVGETAGTVINSVRADLAREYLATSQRSLAQIADLLGFSAASAFSRWFAREFKESPSSWRARSRSHQKAAALPPQPTHSDANPSRYK